MSLQRYIILGGGIFLIGILILFQGVNRAPFRQAPLEHKPGQHSQAAGGNEVCPL